MAAPSAWSRAIPPHTCDVCVDGHLTIHQAPRPLRPAQGCAFLGTFPQMKQTRIKFHKPKLQYRDILSPSSGLKKKPSKNENHKKNELIICSRGRELFPPSTLEDLLPNYLHAYFQVQSSPRQGPVFLFHFCQIAPGIVLNT